MSSLRDDIPRAGYTRIGEKCQCECHRQPGVMHVMACCFIQPPKKDLQGTDYDISEIHPNCGVDIVTVGCPGVVDSI